MNDTELVPMYSEATVMKKLEETGYALPTRPESDEPELPLYLDRLSLADLRRVHSEFAAWQSYLISLLARLEVSVAILKQKRDFIYATIYDEIRERSLGKSTDKVRDISTAIERDERYITVNKAYVETFAMYNAIKTRIQRFEKDMMAINRQISMAINEIQHLGNGNEGW